MELLIPGRMENHEMLMSNFIQNPLFFKTPGSIFIFDINEK